MSWTVLYLILSTLSLSAPGSVTIASAQGQMTVSIKVLQGGDDGHFSGESKK